MQGLPWQGILNHLAALKNAMFTLVVAGVSLIESTETWPLSVSTKQTITIIDVTIKI